MSRFWHVTRILSGTAQGATSAVASPPILLQPRRKALTNTVSVNYPGSGALIDLASLTAEIIVTGQAGTSPTLTTTIQGTNDFMDLNTTLTANLTSGGTTVTLAERTGIAQYDYVMLMAADGSAYEWVQVTSSAATGAGTHTIVRAQFGTTALAFTSGAFLYFTRSWTAIPTANATTTTMISNALSISAATATAPVVATIDSQALGMNRVPFPIIRVLTSVGGSSTPTATYQVNLSGLIRASEYARSR